MKAAFARWLPLLCSLFFGCGNRAEVVVPAHGTVTLDGKPIQAGIITFSKRAEGVAASEELVRGNFNFPELEVGTYTVSVAPPIIPPSMPGEKPPEIPYVDIPKKYQNDAQSGFTAEVTADGPNKFQFDMTTK